MAYIKYGKCDIFSKEENEMIEENERINRLFPWKGDSIFQYLVFDTVLPDDCSDNEKLESLENKIEKIYDDENFFEILKKVKDELENLYTIDPKAARDKAQNILLLIGAIDEYNNILIPFDGVINNNVMKRVMISIFQKGMKLLRRNLETL